MLTLSDLKNTIFLYIRTISSHDKHNSKRLGNYFQREKQIQEKSHFGSMVIRFARRALNLEVKTHCTPSPLSYSPNVDNRGWP